jgi:hypothetical protein
MLLSVEIGADTGENIMPKLTEHPGVSVVAGREVGFPFQLLFKHPVLRDANGKQRQIKRSVKTTDAREAKELACKLSGILRDPQTWRQLPETVPAILKTIWTGDEVDNEISKRIAVATLQEVWPSMSTGIPIEDMTAAQILAFIAKNKLDKDNALARQVSRVMQDMLTEIMQLRASLKSQLNMNQALGADVDAKYSPKLLSDAIKDFYSDDKSVAGTGAKARRKAHTSAHVKRFAKELQDGQIVQAVTPDSVIAHLAKVEKGDYNDGKKPKIDSVKAVWKAIAPFLAHQTKGIFKPHAVKAWIKTHLNGNGMAKKVHPLWLEQENVSKLLSKLPEYWRAVALLNWDGGYRPEELPHLQTANVSFNGDIRIDVQALLDGDRIVWEPKEKRSYGKVNMTEACRATLKKLLKAGGLVLFENDPAKHGWKHPRYSPEQKFEKANKIWHPEEFCRA